MNGQIKQTIEIIKICILLVVTFICFIVSYIFIIYYDINNTLDNYWYSIIPYLFGTMLLIVIVYKIINFNPLEKNTKNIRSEIK